MAEAKTAPKRDLLRATLLVLAAAGGLVLLRNVVLPALGVPT